MKSDIGTGESFLLFFLAAISLWDTATTVIGTHNILTETTKSTVPIKIISFILGAILVVLLVNTVRIMYNPETGVFSALLKFLWIAGVGYDLLTSYWGNRAYVVPIADEASFLQWVILLGVTVFVSAAPVIISFLMDDRWKD